MLFLEVLEVVVFIVDFLGLFLYILFNIGIRKVVVLLDFVK